MGQFIYRMPWIKNAELFSNKIYIWRVKNISELHIYPIPPPTQLDIYLIDT